LGRENDSERERGREAGTCGSAHSQEEDEIRGALDDDEIRGAGWEKLRASDSS
jgi:hypothetical protein